MRRAYVVYGEHLVEAGKVEVWYAICHSMTRADELVEEAEEKDSEHFYFWREVIEEEDE